MSNNPIEGIMNTTMEKIKQMVDANTVIGDPISVGDNSIIVPISKISYGFASGGSDFPSKKDTSDLFGGGGGAGVTILPVALLTICNGEAKLLQIEPFNSTTDRVVGMVPDIVDKIASMIKKDKNEDKKECNYQETE